jgi:hypothetical protein
MVESAISWKNARFFLITHLLRIRSERSERNPSSERLVPKSKESVDIGNTPFMRVLVYTSRALITAEFREMSSDGFTDSLRRLIMLLGNRVSGVDF